MRARPTGWTPIGSPPRPRPTTASPTPFKQPESLRRTRYVTGSRCGTTPRTSLRKIRVQLIGELDAMIQDAARGTARPAVQLRIDRPSPDQRPRALDTTGVTDPVVSCGWT